MQPLALPRVGLKNGGQKGEKFGLVPPVFFHQISHHSNSGFLGERGDLIAGGRDESWGTVPEFEPVEDGLLEFLHVHLWKPQIGGDASGEDEILSRLVATFPWGEVSGRFGRDGVGTVGVGVADHSYRSLEPAVDMDGDELSGAVETRDAGVVEGARPKVKESRRLQVAGEIVAHDDEFDRRLRQHLDETQ